MTVFHLCVLHRLCSFIWTGRCQLSKQTLMKYITQTVVFHSELKMPTLHTRRQNMLLKKLFHFGLYKCSVNDRQGSAIRLFIQFSCICKSVYFSGHEVYWKMFYTECFRLFYLAISNNFLKINYVDFYIYVYPQWWEC